MLVGQAGTGKGVVIGAAREAWERDGRRVIGTAVAGATAKRLGADCGIEETMTMDALTTRHASGRLGLDGGSVIVVDEAGMADTRRLAKLVELAGESRAKLLLVGDRRAALADRRRRAVHRDLEARADRGADDGSSGAGVVGARGVGAAPCRRLGAGARAATRAATGCTSRTRGSRRASGWSTTGRGFARSSRGRGS